jgi:hypothetical protein
MQSPDNPLLPRTIPQAVGAAVFIASAASAWPVGRRLAAVPPAERTDAMRHAAHDIRLGTWFVGIGVALGVVGWVILRGAVGQLIGMGGLGTLGVLGLVWLWSGRVEGETALAQLPPPAPDPHNRAERRRAAHEAVAAVHEAPGRAAAAAAQSREVAKWDRRLALAIYALLGLLFVILGSLALGAREAVVWGLYVVALVGAVVTGVLWAVLDEKRGR